MLQKLESTSKSLPEKIKSKPCLSRTERKRKHRKYAIILISYVIMRSK